MSIKNVLTLQFIGIVASILIVFSIFTYQFSNIFRESEFNDRLKERANKWLVIIVESNEIDTSSLHLFFKYNLSAFSGQRYFIYKDFKLFFKSHDNLSKLEQSYINTLIRKKVDFSVNRGDSEYVAFTKTIKGSNYYMLAHAVDVAGHEKINNLKYILVFLFVCSIIIAGISGRIFAHQALSPIAKVVEQVDEISERNLHLRVDEGNGEDELAKLAITFNKMLTRLEKSFALQKSFVSNTSHEFRTPLTAMKGQIEVALMQSRSSIEYENALMSLLEDINNQIELLGGLHDLAKANADFPGDKFESISFAELLHDMKEDLLKRFPNYKIKINIKEFPEVEEKILMKGNYHLLKSAISNLVDNACKYSADLKCQVETDFAEKEICVKVIDQGLGISQEDLGSIFEPFYRSNNTRNIKGYGIGLSLAKKIIEHHSGIITVNSEEGKGTIIDVRFPNLT